MYRRLLADFIRLTLEVANHLTISVPSGRRRRPLSPKRPNAKSDFDNDVEPHQPSPKSITPTQTACQIVTGTHGTFLAVFGPLELSMEYI